MLSYCLLRRMFGLVWFHELVSTRLKACQKRFLKICIFGRFWPKPEYNFKEALDGTGLNVTVQADATKKRKITYGGKRIN